MLCKDLHFPNSALIQNAISGQILGNVLFCIFLIVRMNSECHFWPNTWKCFVLFLSPSFCGLFPRFIPVFILKLWPTFLPGYTPAWISRCWSSLWHNRKTVPWYCKGNTSLHTAFVVKNTFIDLMSASSCRNWKTCNGQSIKLKWTWNGYQIIQELKLDLFLDFLVLL
jgi:hypothetical protein